MNAFLSHLHNHQKDNYQYAKIEDTKNGINSSIEGIVFDVSQYKRTKEVGLSEEAKRILRTPIETRTAENIKTACSALIDAVPDFEDFPVDMQNSIVKVSLLQEFQAGRIIIRQNHKADNFYMIVSGISLYSFFYEPT